MKLTLVLSILVLLFVPADTFSQVNLSYDVEVTSASGPHASLFPARQRLLVSYTLDPAATDSNADPSRGIFNNAVLSMSISFPGLGISANSGPAGLAQTFNDVAPVGNPCRLSDQVFIFGGPITSASTLGGETITNTEVDFLSGFVTPPASPGMLSSDALPIVSLPFIESFVVLRTAGATTFVHFSAPSRDRIEAIASRVELLFTNGVLTRSQADRLINKIDAALSGLDRGNTRQVCDNLRDFVSRVNDLIDDGSLSRTAGQGLIDSARDIRALFGCS